jgi:inhibitor of KinA sporulation pathway (predicted exonuclease)
MKYIVLDLEMNQPSGSIIEIGAVCIDLKTGRQISAFSELININEILNPFITELTGIRPEELALAKSLPVVLAEFWAWVEEQNVRNIASWGTDYYLLTEESKKAKVIYPGKLRFLNIKEFASVFRACFPAVKQTGGLKATMNLFGLEFEGRQHRGLNDSIQTARLLVLLKENMRKFLSIQKIIA